MPYFIFQKSKGTTNWTLKATHQDYNSARAARAMYTNEAGTMVARIVTAQTESEARGKNGTAWNAITNDPDRKV